MIIDLNEFHRLSETKLQEKAENLPGRLNRAKNMYRKASMRRDKKSMQWWKSVYHNTKAAMKSGGAVKGGGGSGGASSSSGDSQGGEGGRVGTFLKKMGSKSKAAAEAFRKLPAASKKFFSDPAYRKKTAKSLAGSLRKKAKHAVAHVKEEAEEFKVAGAAVGKMARGKPISGHEKTAMKKAAKAIAMTVIGTAAMGGIGHVTLAGLAKHFAAETAVKAVAKAAVMSSLMHNGLMFITEEEVDEKALQAWAGKLVELIADEIEKLGDADEDELAALLEKIG